LVKPLIFAFLICITTGTFSYSQESGSFTDKRDGHEYKTVRIGDQLWMAENMVYKTAGDYRVYENIEGYAETCGYLYSWETAKDVCPEGWHLPTDAEFVDLVSSQGGLFETAGGKLKETGTTHWKSPNAGATNSSGLTALSCGKSDDNEGKYYLGVMTFFWTSEDMDDNTGVSYALYSSKAEFSRYGLEKGDGVSVRCLKDQ
jgi:uncharacterized protein (TIGR02145 family)